MGLLSMLGLARASEVRELREQVESVRFAAGMTARREGSGVSITAGRFTIEEQQMLMGSKRWSTLRSMENDAHVKAAHQAQMGPLIAGEWEYKSGSDKPKDKDCAEFLNAVLLRKPSDKYGREFFTRTPWKGQRLQEIGDMLLSGYALFHRSYRAVGTKQVIDLKWLEPSSVDPSGWELDDEDNILSVKRTFALPSGTSVYLRPIQAEDLALFVWDLKGARFEGRPFTRSMFGAWWRKDNFLRFAAIAGQKFGAPIPIGYYPPGWGDEEKRKFQDFLPALLGSAPADAIGMFPLGDDGKTAQIQWAGMEGEVDRMRSLINGENAEIAHAGGQKSQLAGEMPNGSRSVAETQQNAESLGYQALAEVICEQETHGVANLTGIAEDLANRNYSGLTEVPRLCCQKVGPEEDRRWAERIEKGVGAGLIPLVPETKKVYCERAGIVLKDADYLIDTKPAPLMPGKADPTAPGKGEGDGDGEDPPSGTDENGEYTAAGAEIDELVAGLPDANRSGTEAIVPAEITENGNGRRRYREAIPDEVWDAAKSDLVPVNDLIATQRSVSREKLAGFMQDADAVASEPIRVVRVGGSKHYISDGHHRFAAAKLLGWKSLPAKIVDLDSEPVSLAEGDTEFDRMRRAPEGMKVITPGEAKGGRGAMPRGWFRLPTPFEEQFVSLGAIQRELEVFESRYYHKAKPVLVKIQVDVVERVSDGRINERNYSTLRRKDDGPNLKYGGELRREIRKLIGEIGAFGGEQVRQELRKQAQASAHLAVPRGPKVVAITSELYDTRAAIDTDTLLGNLEDLVIRELERLFAQGLKPSEVARQLEAFFGDLSDKPIGELARKTGGRAFNIGRNLEIQRKADQIAFVIRTEILDGNTCAPCRGLDGKKFYVGSSAYFENMPPAQCEGDDRCRGFYLVVGDLREEAA